MRFVRVSILKNQLGKSIIEIRDQSHDAVQDFKNSVVDSFAKIRRHPFAYQEFAFEALYEGNRIGSTNGYRLYDWLHVEFLAVS